MNRIIYVLLLSVIVVKTYGQNSSVKIEKKSIKVEDAKYDATIYDKKRFDFVNSKFSLPAIAPKDQILFDKVSDISNLIPNKRLIEEIVAKTLMAQRAKLHIEHLEGRMLIGLRFYVDSKTFKVLFINYDFDFNDLKTLSFGVDLDKELMAVADKLIKPNNNFILPQSLVHYGYLRPSYILTWKDINDKIQF